MDLDEMSIFSASITEFTGTAILSMSPALVLEHPTLFVAGPVINTSIIAFLVSIYLYNWKGGSEHFYNQPKNNS